MLCYSEKWNIFAEVLHVSDDEQDDGFDKSTRCAEEPTKDHATKDDENGDNPLDEGEYMFVFSVLIGRVSPSLVVLTIECHDVQRLMGMNPRTWNPSSRLLFPLMSI